MVTFLPVLPVTGCDLAIVGGGTVLKCRSGPLVAGPTGLVRDHFTLSCMVSEYVHPVTVQGFDVESPVEKVTGLPDPPPVAEAA
jgi:hypothetical protein